MKTGDKKEMFTFIFKNDRVWVDVFTFGDYFEAHAFTDYSMCIERGVDKTTCVNKSIQRLLKSKPPQS